MLSQLQSITQYATWDALVLLGLHGGVFLYGLLNRRNHLLSVVFSLYISQIIFEHTRLLDPFLNSQSATPLEVFYFRAALFVVLIAVIGTIIYKKAFGDGGPRIRFWKIILFAITIGGLFVSSALRLLPVSELYEISPLVSKLFIGQTPVFVWLALPIFAMLTLIRKA